jgi:hypothetical protein
MKSETKVKSVTREPLRNWYFNLPKIKSERIRMELVRSLGINPVVFYRWLSGQTPVPVSAQIVINQATGKQIFNVPDIINIDSILQEQDV